MDSGGGGGNPYSLRGGGGAAAWARLVGGEEEGVGGGGYGRFLEACFLCRKPLAGNRDIFMYRGDTPFCSEECRREQMEADEEKERKEKAAAAAKKLPLARRDVEAPPKPHKVRAGSILAG